MASEVARRSPAVDAFFAGFVDYAGMFPPASLPLDEAIEAFSRFLQSGDSWMLGRFVCPAARVGDLVPHAPKFSPGFPCRLSVLLPPLEEAETWAAYVSRHVHAVRESLRPASGAYAVEAFELRVSPDSAEAADSWISAAAEAFDSAASPSAEIFLEIPYRQGYPAAEAMARAIRAYAESQRGYATTRRLSAKVRCGGSSSAEFPSSRQLAAAIWTLSEHRVPWKATAGLHHPFPVEDRKTGGRMHGFVNVFLGGILAADGSINEEGIIALLEDEDPRHFRFDPEAVQWRSHSVSAEAVAEKRSKLVLGVGSCSFEEPRADLRRRGILKST